MIQHVSQIFTTARQHRPFAHFSFAFLVTILLMLNSVAPSSSSLLKNGMQPGQERSAPTGAAQDQKDLPLLEVGKPIERELAGGQTHSYQITLAAGQYLHAVVEQQGIDVVVTVFGPDGKQLVEVDSPNEAQGPEPVYLVTETAGVYRLEVKPLAKDAKPGRYTMKAEEVRAATTQDHSRVLAHRHVSEAVLLDAQGTAESRRKAAEKYLESLQHWRSAGDRVGEANTLTFIGNLYNVIGKKQEALGYFSQALLLKREVGDKIGEADVLINIGAIYVSLGDKQKALEFFNQALPLTQAVGDKTRETMVYSYFGMIYFQLGDKQKASEYAGKGLPLAQAAGNKALESVFLFFRGMLNVGDSGKKVLEPLNQALPLAQSSEFKFGEAAILGGIGMIHTLLGDIQKALDSLNQSLSQARATGNKDVEVSILSSIGMIYSTLGDNQKAQDSYNQALSLSRSAGNKASEAGILSQLGKLYYSIGDDEKALEFFNQALSLARAVGDKSLEIGILSGMGLVHSRSGGKQKALEPLNQALSLARAAGDRFAEVSILYDVGAVYDRLGDKQNALEFFNQALPLAQAIDLKLKEAIINCNIGAIYLQLGDQQKAFEYTSRALSLSRVVGAIPWEGYSLYGLARIARKDARLKEAQAYAEEALKLFESIRSTAKSPEMRASYFAGVRDYYDFYVDLLMQMHQREPAQKYNLAALQGNERARARSLLELLVEARADIRQGADSGLVNRERSLQQQIRGKAFALLQLQLAGKKEKDDQVLALGKEIGTLTTEFQQVQAQIRTTSPRYAALTQPQPISLPEIQAQLDEDTLLLEYNLGKENSYLWAVTPATISSYQLPKREEIEALARSVYQLLTARQLLPGETEWQQSARVKAADAAYPEQALRLSQMVLGPVADQLGAKRLVIVADGALQYVPFSALPKPMSQTARSAQGKDLNLTPLMATNEIVALPSVSALAVMRRELKGRQPAAKSVAVLADPVFSNDDERVRLIGGKQGTQKAGSAHDPDSALTRAVRSMGAMNERSGIARLPFSRRESEAIIALARRGDGLQALDFKANRATAASEVLGQYRIVHFATHGLLNTERPELSGIVLSLVDEKGQPQDGFLQLHEVFNLKLPAELVVLSACQTGLGKEVRGEGLVGLTRGFMYAGAARVMASLWQVNDAATAELMERFYRGMLKEGKRPAEALRIAQLEMWKQGRGRWRAPYYWASFVLQGEWK